VGPPLAIEVEVADQRRDLGATRGRRARAGAAQAVQAGQRAVGIALADERARVGDGADGRRVLARRHRRLGRRGAIVFARADGGDAAATGATAASTCAGGAAAIGAAPIGAAAIPDGAATIGGTGATIGCARAGGRDATGAGRAPRGVSTGGAGGRTHSPTGE